MNALNTAQRKWKAASARRTAALARRQDCFLSVTVTGSILVVLLVTLVGRFH